MKKTLLTCALLSASLLASPVFAAKYKVIDVANGGTISGKVTFKGNDPAPTVYPITKDNDVCGSGNREIDYVKVNNGALNDAVVYLTKVKEGKKFAPIEGKINQDKCTFEPFLSVMTNDQNMGAKNSDPVLHNIHTYEMIGRSKKTVLNVSQPEQGAVTNKKIKLKRGDAMKLECDAHDFMHGFVFVAKNPYYAVVNKDGSFTIKDVPAGKYKINAWHGTLGIQKGKVEVAAKGTATVNFEYKGK
ncbi:MAG: carboxypeptidase-like regulatory domain-containing protein [Gammaproteobacteria bacterium]